MRYEIEKIMEQVEKYGWIECPECGNYIEPDTEKCICEWKNPLMEYGII